MYPKTHTLTSLLFAYLHICTFAYFSAMKGLSLSILIVLLLVGTTRAQPSDFITLKKRGKTIKTYFKGSTVQFSATNGSSYNVVIDDIRHDTLFATEYIIVQMPTRLGVYVLDTATRYHYQFHYSEIRSIHQEKKGFNFANSGYSLMGGSVLLMLGSGVAYLADRDKFSPALLGAAAGLGVVGYLLTRLQITNFKIGKKYRLHYIAVKPIEVQTPIKRL
jgi:hypothetical protein